MHDALLGAIGYGIEAILALAGKRGHQASDTWLDVVYCGLVLVMGLSSLILVILQPTVFHAWCTLCLTSAVISEAIVLLSFHDYPRRLVF